MGVDADETEKTLPPLYHACMANDVALVSRLLAAGADPNDGESVYHAAQLNRRECLELMLAAAAINRWNEAPEGMASTAVVAVLRSRGLTT